jgi:hypothetical protein
MLSNPFILFDQNCPIATKERKKEGKTKKRKKERKKKTKETKNEISLNYFNMSIQRRHNR